MTGDPNHAHLGALAARSAASHRRRGPVTAQLRIPLTAERFATGMSWKDFLVQMGDGRARTEDHYQKAVLTDEERQFFSGLSQIRYVLVLAENWCRDVQCNAPLIARIAEAMPNCELRVFLRDHNLDLADCFLNNGHRSIPVVVLFDKEWNEIARWIERSAVATQRIFAIRAETIDVAPADHKEVALDEFFARFIAAYDTSPDRSLWRETAKEVRLVLETRLGLAAKSP